MYCGKGRKSQRKDGGTQGEHSSCDLASGALTALQEFAAESNLGISLSNNKEEKGGEGVGGERD